MIHHPPLFRLDKLLGVVGPLGCQFGLLQFDCNLRSFRYYSEKWLGDWDKIRGLNIESKDIKINLIEGPLIGFWIFTIEVDVI